MENNYSMSIGRIFKASESKKLEIGIIMCFLSLASINLLRFALEKELSYTINIIAFFVPFFLITNWKAIMRGHFPRWNILYSIILIIFSWTLLSSVFSGYSLLGTHGMIYTMYPMAIMIGMASNNRAIDEKFFFKTSFYLSGILNVVALYVITNRFSDFSRGINSIYSSDGSIIADRLTLTAIPSFYIMIGLLYGGERKNIISFAVKILFWCCALLTLLLLHRRGPTVSLSIAAVFSFFYKRPLKKKNTRFLAVIKTALKITFTVTTIFVLYNNVTFLKDKIDNLATSVQRSIATLFGNYEFGRDVSAGTREIIRNEILAEYPSFSISEILFGKGYMYRYLDFPLLQAFIDSGFVGGILFFIIHVIISAKYVFCNNKTKIQQFLNFGLISNIIGLFYSGLPYGWQMYLVVVFSIYVSTGYKRNSEQEMYLIKQELFARYAILKR